MRKEVPKSPGLSKVLLGNQNLEVQNFLHFFVFAVNLIESLVSVNTCSKLKKNRNFVHFVRTRDLSHFRKILGENCRGSKKLHFFLVVCCCGASTISTWREAHVTSKSKRTKNKEQRRRTEDQKLSLRASAAQVCCWALQAAV